LINESAIQKYAVCVVQHYFVPKNNIHIQKNWSSVIVWNCYHKSNLILAPELVSESEAVTQNRLAWLKDN